MAKKSKYNDAAMRYAMDYLDHLLELETYVDSQVEKKLERMVERKLAQQEHKNARLGDAQQEHKNARLSDAEQEHKHAQASDASQAQDSREIINQKQDKL